MDTNKYAKPHSGATEKTNIKITNPLEKTLGGWMTKPKNETIVLHTPHLDKYSGAGEINKHNTYKPHSNVLGGSKLQHIVTKEHAQKLAYTYTYADSSGSTFTRAIGSSWSRKRLMIS